jgi:hypothetical protein
MVVTMSRRARHTMQVLVTLAAVSALAITTTAIGAASTVQVPRVTGLSAASAYRLLHRLGLRVSLPAVDLRFVVDPPEHVVSLTPAVGKRVNAGAVVAVTLGCPGCAAASPGVPIPLPRYRVPAFVRRTLQSAYRWVAHRQLYYEFHLGRLTAGNAASLFGNYRVTRQKPDPGRELTLGRGTRCCHGTGGTFRPTPLVVWATAQTDRR